MIENEKICYLLKTRRINTLEINTMPESLKEKIKQSISLLTDRLIKKQLLQSQNTKYEASGQHELIVIVWQPIPTQQNLQPLPNHIYLGLFLNYKIQPVNSRPLQKPAAIFQEPGNY